MTTGAGSSGGARSTFGCAGGGKPGRRHVHRRSLAGPSFWCRFTETVLNAAVLTRYLATDLIDQTDNLFLIVAVHQLQSSAGLLLLHVAQGTLQAEHHILVLLYDHRQVAQMLADLTPPL